jgi:hypothetical protein
MIRRTARCFAIEGSVRVIPDYAEVVGARNLPDPNPQDLDEDAIGIAAHIQIEQRRFMERPRFFDADSLPIIDRSVHTLMAHRAGLDALKHTGTRYEAQAASVLGGSLHMVWPSYVIYLDLPHDVLLQRHGDKPQDLYTDATFVAGCRSYFTRMSDALAPVQIVWIDATQSRHAVLEAALAFIKENFARDRVVEER